MSPERFRQIEELYHAAREATADERVALLAQTDPELRREVELLLSQRPGGEFLDRPAIQNASELLGDSTVTELAAGARLGPYRIESKLGEGGMGEVFRAVDTRLGRAVAIKTTREQFSGRFEREARAISSLNHPNICTLYDVGPKYLVMELVEGETLAARLKSGPLPLKTALLYASQIGTALAEAHGKGIIHRDLKPGNIMIAKSGVKVLDFGLAKSVADETVTASHMVMGTPAYMAPEQREGKPADARSDIYSFGCVLYEMFTGARVGSPGRRVPSRKLEKIIGRCLEEDPGRRWQSAAELERQLAATTVATTRWVRIVSAAAVIVALFAAAYYYLHRAPKLTDKDTIILADFVNTTGDPVFDGTLRQGLSVQLEQSPFLSLISDERIQQTLRLMNQPVDARLTPVVAKEICERTASAAVLEGSIANLGSQYVLGLRAKNCRTGEVLDEEQVQAAKKEDVLNVLSQIASKFRTRVGESLATVQKYDTPLAEAMTPSVEALKAYSTGWKVASSTGNAAAVPFFERAVELDPKFAMAYARLGHAQAVGLGESALASENITKAYQLRDRASDSEKLFIAASYDMDVTGNLEKAEQTFELWEQTYPRDIPPHGFLSGTIYRVLGKYEKAVEEGKKQIEVGPDIGFAYVNSAFSLKYVDRLGEAEKILQQASAHKLEMPELSLIRYEIAFLRGDQAGMEREVARDQGISGAKDQITDQDAFASVYFGHLQQARRKAQHAADLAQLAAHPARARAFEAGPALWEALFGNVPEARQAAMPLLKLSQAQDVEYGAAFALAFVGDASPAESVVKDLETRFRDDTVIKYNYLPALRALLALKPPLSQKSEPSKAIELLQMAVPYEMGVPPSSRYAFFGALYPIYVRGQAYLAAHQGAEAAVEFQKILDHRGIVVSDPIGALAHLQLGRALTLSGDIAKAKTAYQDFLTLWKAADPDIPILQQAKAELTKLQRKGKS